jgi:hypothetical protein
MLAQIARNQHRLLPAAAVAQIVDW